MRRMGSERSPLRCVSTSFSLYWSTKIQPSFTFAFNTLCSHTAQVDPRFVMTCWVFCRESHLTLCDQFSNAPCPRISHSAWVFGGWTSPRTSVHSLGLPPAPHNGVGSGAQGAWRFWTLLQEYCRVAARVLMCDANSHRWSHLPPCRRPLVVWQYRRPIMTFKATSS